MNLDDIQEYFKRMVANVRQSFHQEIVQPNVKCTYPIDNCKRHLEISALQGHIKSQDSVIERQRSNLTVMAQRRCNHCGKEP